MKKINLILFLTLAGMSGAYSQCMIEVPLTERIDASTVIFEGKTLGKVSFWNTAHTSIFTATTVEVYKLFKGIISFGPVEIVYEGGIAGDEMEIVSNGVELEEGQYGIFMLQPAKVLNSPNSVSADNKFEPFAGAQSVVKYDLVDKTASDPFKTYSNIENQLYKTIQNHLGSSYKLVNPFDINQGSINNVGPARKQEGRSSGFAHFHIFCGLNMFHDSISSVAPVITGFSPPSIAGGTLSVLTINGSGFGTNSGSAKVEFRDVNNGGASYIAATATDIISWSATQIQVQVPPRGGTGTVRVTDNIGASVVSSADLTVPYGEYLTSSGERIKMVNQNTAGGYTIQYNTGFNTNTAAVAAFERALSTWRCSTFVNYKHIGTTTVACQASDGICMISFDNSCALGSGVKATTYSYYTGCGTPTSWTLKEFDIKISSTAAGPGWNFGPVATSGGKYDFETTALHELGHSQQQTHVISTTALMHYTKALNADVRVPDPNAISGVNEVLSRSSVSNSCGPTAHINISASGCAITGINEAIENNSGVNLYPNPFNNTAELHLDPSLLLSTGYLSFTLFDVLGNQASAAVNINTEKFEIVRNGLPNGIYFYQLKSGNDLIAAGKIILTEDK